MTAPTLDPAAPATAPVRELGYASATSAWWAQVTAEATPELQWPQSLEVYDRMRREDAQVASVFRAVTLPIRRTPWRIDPNGARPEVVAHVSQDLGLDVVGEAPVVGGRMRDRFSWPEHLQHALLMLVYGHMYFEQVYRIDADGRARLRKLGPRLPRTLSAINVARDGGLASIEQAALAADLKARTVTLPVSRLVAYVYEREGGNWRGTSLLRPAYANWLIKRELLRTQAQTIDRNGMGVPVYEGAPGGTKADLLAGLKTATGLRSGSEAGAATPNGAKMRLLGVEGQLPDADVPIRYHDEQIARVVLAHFLNLGTQTGSWALGSTFADFFTLGLQTLAQQIADVATQHIVEDLVDLNYGTSEPAPRIVCDEIGSRQVATAQAVKLLVDAGVLTPDEALERATRSTLGLPAPEHATARPRPAPAPAT